MKYFTGVLRWQSNPTPLAYTSAGILIKENTEAAHDNWWIQILYRNRGCKQCEHIDLASELMLVFHSNCRLLEISLYIYRLCSSERIDFWWVGDGVLCKITMERSTETF